MSQYVAKKAMLDTMRECSERSCRCYTEKGYYIKYANCNVSGVLFVCEDCFETKYRSRYVIHGFSISEKSYCNSQRKELDHPTLRSIIRAFNKTIRVVKYASFFFFVIAVILVGVSPIGNGFSALAIHTFTFSAVLLALLVIAAIANSYTKKSKFNTKEIKKVLFVSLGFMTLFALFDYFLIP